MEARRDSDVSAQADTASGPSNQRPAQDSGGEGSGSQPRRREEDETRWQRAPQACLRCRRKKLRCTGGCPCAKCLRAQEKCDFGKRPNGDGHDRSEGEVQPGSRIAQLEQTVASLLSDLSSLRPSAPTTSALPQYPPSQVSPAALGTLASSTDLLPGSGSMPSAYNSNDPLLPFQLPRSDPIFGPSSHLPQRTVHFGPSPTDSQTGASAGSVTSDKRKNKESPQNRLAVASLAGQGYSAPFQALTYHPGVWENREQSRRSSPQPGAASRDEGWPAFEAKAGPRDDPVTLELVDMAQAETLFDFFFAKCHPFLPIVTSADASPFNDIRRRCGFLFTTIIAIGSRFYLKHCARHGVLPTIAPATPAAIARLAYSHLAASLFRKQHQLADVQATLLLAGWGLQSGGGGPDPWLVTGHCARLAQRLGLHRPGPLPTTPEQAEKQLLQSRTWLAWYHFDGFLSLGFGRPQSQGFAGIDEQAFLQLGASSASGSEMRMDLYIASMVQLTKIGGDLISWIQLLTDWQADISRAPLTQDGQDYSVGAMLGELNKRLDEWTTRWTWNGSLSAIHLGTSGRLAKLQSEHIRLCLNSLALKPGLVKNDGSPESALMASYIQKATEAAINTVQAHADAVKEDMYLSYSFDYITIALGQAAVFLIRLHSTTCDIPVDRAVIAYYLRTAIELLEDTELSETKNSTYVGRICRDLSGVAGIAIPPRASEESPSQLQFWNDAGLPLIDNNSEFDLASFLQFDNTGMDFGMLFGLPTDALNFG